MVFYRQSLYIANLNIWCAMGIVIYGGGVDQIKGKVGGVVHQKLGSSLSVRKLAIPTANNSAALSSSQHHASVLATTWANLTGAQKLDWHTKSSGYPATNRYGVTITLNGYQLFWKINKVLLTVGANIVTTPSVYSLQPALVYDVANVDYGNHHFIMTFTGSMSYAYYIILYIYGFQGLWMNDNNLKFKTWIAIGYAGISTVDLWTYLPSKFQVDPGPGYKFIVNAMSVEIATGRYGLYGTVYDGQQ
jgi:hypothetical protein